MDKIIVVAGPTAVGKTSASIELALRIDGEIISADSMQIYKGLDIGTAKPTAEEKSYVPHHMIDVCDPSVRFSVAQYVNMADDIIQKILDRGKTPIIVGGTGLYIDNLICSNDFGDMAVTQELRDDLNRKADELGTEALLNELIAIDPEYGKGLHANDKKRIVHSLEIYYTTGKTQSQLIKESRTAKPKYECLYTVLNCSSRDVLYDRINLRVGRMMEDGLLNEAQRVIDSEWFEGSTASQAIGYKEFIPYFQHNSSLDQCVDILKQHSRNYAKRQLTWFRRRDDALFINTDETQNVCDYILSRL